MLEQCRQLLEPLATSRTFPRQAIVIPVPAIFRTHTEHVVTKIGVEKLLPLIGQGGGFVEVFGIDVAAAVFDVGEHVGVFPIAVCAFIAFVDCGQVDLRML